LHTAFLDSAGKGRSRQTPSPTVRPASLLLLATKARAHVAATSTTGLDDTRARRRGACRRPQPRAKAGANRRPGVERLLIVLSVAQRTPPPPGRPSGHARLSDDDGPPRPAATQSGCSISASRRRRHGRPQPAAGAPSSPARRPDRLAFYMGCRANRRKDRMSRGKCARAGKRARRRAPAGPCCRRRTRERDGSRG
jgi:hypothetical protein